MLLLLMQIRGGGRCLHVRLCRVIGPPAPVSLPRGAQGSGRRASAQCLYGGGLALARILGGEHLRLDLGPRLEHLAEVARLQLDELDGGARQHGGVARLARGEERALAEKVAAVELGDDHVERLVDDDGDAAAEHDVERGGDGALAADPLVAREDLEPDGRVERLVRVRVRARVRVGRVRVGLGSNPNPNQGRMGE